MYTVLDFARNLVLSPYDEEDPNLQGIHMRAAIDRDNRLNAEERKAVDAALIEAEYGPKFHLRAHP